MVRRDFIKHCGFGAAAVTAYQSALFAGSARRKPNFLVIMADDLSAKDIGVYGSTDIATPNLDRMAHEGMYFKTGWATPICSPSRVEILTGRYGFRTGVTSLVHSAYGCGEWDSSDMFHEQHLTFANVLQCAGYATAIAGKWQLAGTNVNIPDQLAQCGFDEHCLWMVRDCYFPRNALPKRAAAARYWNSLMMKNGKFLPTTGSDFGPDIETDFLIDFAQRHADGPFCLYYPMTLPHEPITSTPDPENPGSRTEPSFTSMVQYIDHIVGRLEKALAGLGVLDNTLIIFTGDNGSAGYGKNASGQEKGPRVPFIVKGRGVQVHDAHDALVDLSDIFPTLAELAGVSMEGYTLDGKSFAPVLDNTSPKVRDWIFSYQGGGRWLRDSRYLLDAHGDFWDCGDNRDEHGYRKIDGGAEKDRFLKILEAMPASEIVAGERKSDWECGKTRTNKHIHHATSDRIVQMFSNRLVVDAEPGSRHTIRIFAPDGHLVWRKARIAPGMTYLRTRFSKGMYTIRIQNGKTIRTVRQYVVE